MSQIPPLEPRTPARKPRRVSQVLQRPPARLDKKLSDYIHKLSQKRTYDPLYYYAVVFEQPLGNGMLRRAATVSQSPQIIQAVGPGR